MSLFDDKKTELNELLAACEAKGVSPFALYYWARARAMDEDRAEHEREIRTDPDNQDPDGAEFVWTVWDEAMSQFECEIEDSRDQIAAEWGELDDALKAMYGERS